MPHRLHRIPRRRVLGPAERFASFTPPEPFVPDSIGHHEEWIEACKTRGATTCGFEYSGVLTEAVLLGNVACRSGRRLEWNAASLSIPNAPGAEALLRRESRRGWAV